MFDTFTIKQSESITLIIDTAKRYSVDDADFIAINNTIKPITTHAFIVFSAIFMGDIKR